MNSLFKTITGGTGQAENENVSSMVPALAVNTCSKILIHDLELMMSIGVLDHEKVERQRVIVNVDLKVEPNKQWQKDEIADVVSYADMIERIEMIAAAGHINLVETFAERIGEAALSFPSVLSARINVQKPDIIKNTKSVGVEIFIDKA